MANPVEPSPLPSAPTAAPLGDRAHHRDRGRVPRARRGEGPARARHGRAPRGRLGDHGGRGGHVDARAPRDRQRADHLLRVHGGRRPRGGAVRRRRVAVLARRVGRRARRRRRRVRRAAPHDRGVRRAVRPGGGALAAAHADRELPLGAHARRADRLADGRRRPARRRGGRVRERPRPPPRSAALAARGDGGGDPARGAVTGARSKLRARLLLLGSAASFGLMAVLARRLSRGDGAFSAGQLTVIRFIVGAAVSVVAFRLSPGLYAPHNRRLLWTRGVSGGIVVVLYFLALQRIPAGEAGMLYNLFPVVATGMSAIAFRERPTVHLALALVVATAGVVLVLGDGSLRVGLGAGEAFALAAAVFAAFS